jgi:hypothetical protein
MRVVRATSRTQEMQADPLVTPAAGFIALQNNRQAYPDATEDGREPVSVLYRVRELLPALCERYERRSGRWREYIGDCPGPHTHHREERPVLSTAQTPTCRYHDLNASHQIQGVVMLEQVPKGVATRFGEAVRYSYS